MRFNSRAQIARDHTGAAVAAWLDDDTEIFQQPVDLAKPDGPWHMVTRKNGIVAPIPHTDHGCNSLAAGNGRWMRRYDGMVPQLSGSQAWTPSDGYPGDVSDEWACTIDHNNTGISAWLMGKPDFHFTRVSPFGGLRLQKYVAAWVSFPGPRVQLFDLFTEEPVTVDTLGPSEYTPIAFWHEPSQAYWVAYQTDLMGGVLHKSTDKTQGYKFGSPLDIYDPDVCIDHDYGCTIGWSVDPGQLQQGRLVIPLLGVGMVPLTAPEPPVPPQPDKPFGPLSEPSPPGTAVNVNGYFLTDTSLTPRDGTHYSHQVIDRLPNGDIRWNWIKFNPAVFKGQYGEIWYYDAKNAMWHLQLDASNKDLAHGTDTRWCPRDMKTGIANAFQNSRHELVRQDRNCTELGRGPHRLKMWVEHYVKWWFGPDLKERPALVLYHDPTDGITGADRGIERYVFAFGAGPTRWEYFRSDYVKQDGGFTDHARVSRSDFYIIKGQPIAPDFPKCLPPIYVPPVEPPMPPIDPPSPVLPGTLKPGQELPVDHPLVSQDKRFTLLYQTDGNLVLYGPDGPLWAAGTMGKSVGFVAMQGDGNLVVYDKSGKPVWASNTNSNPLSSCLVQNDGNMVIYSPAGKPVWATNTIYKPLPPGPVARPTPEDVVNVRGNFCNLTDSRGRAIFDPFIMSLPVEERADWYAIHRANGSTHLALAPDIHYPLYTETTGIEPMSTLDQPAKFRQVVLEALNTKSANGRGFVPIVFLDEGASNPRYRVDTFWKPLLAAIKDLLPCCIVVPGWELVKESEWTSADLSYGSKALGAIAKEIPMPNIWLHLSEGRASGASNPIEPDDPWQGAERMFWYEHGGEVYNGFLYQSYTVRDGQVYCKEEDGSCYLNRLIDVVDRICGGLNQWRIMNLCIFEAPAYYYTRGKCSSKTARDWATECQRICVARGYKVGFGNGLPW